MNRAKQTTNAKAGYYILQTQDFESNTGSFYGYNADPDGHFHTSMAGRLPDDWRKEFFNSLTNKLTTYIVFSYGTPIAWLEEDGYWRIPQVSYSTTTSKHQFYTRKAIDPDVIVSQL